MASLPPSVTGASRRAILGLGLATLSASFSGGEVRAMTDDPSRALAAEPPRRGRAIIDVHSHPSMALYHRLAQEMDHLGPGDRFPNRIFFPPGMPEWTPNWALDLMGQENIRAQVLSLPDVTVGLRGATARKWARDINEALAKVVADHPGRFGAFGVIPHDDMDSSLAEIAYALDVLKLDGITTTTNIRGAYLGDPVFDPWLEELHRRSAVLFVHPTLPEVLNPASPPLIEFCFDSSRMVMHMALSGAKRRFSGIKLISTHGGGTVPYIAHRLETLQPIINPKGPGSAGGNRRRSTLLLFRSDFMRYERRPALAAITRFVDKSKLMMGFDFPYAPARTIRPEIERFEHFAGIDAREKTMIESSNALALFPRLEKAAAV